MKKIIGIVIIAIFIIATNVILIWAICPNLSPDWTGFGEYPIIENVAPKKKLWDWMDLLIVPILIAITVWWLGWLDNQNQIKIDNEKAQRESLNEFFKTISFYLLDKNLRNSKIESEIRSLARSRTIEFISRADSKRKGAILQFLFESALINSDPVINLNGVRFDNSDFKFLSLKGVKLAGIYFKNCDFSNSNFFDSNFAASDFSGSNFSLAKFDNCNIAGAKFTFAKMRGIELRNTDLSQTFIDGVDFHNADLSKSIMKKEQLEKLKNKEFKIAPKII